MSPVKPTATAEAEAKKATATTRKSPPTATASDRTDYYFSRHLTPPDLSNVRDNFPQMDPKTAKVVWRDFLFVCLGAVAVSMIGFVESNASNAEARSLAVRFAGMITFGNSGRSSDYQVNPNGIVDTGYIVTQPLFEWLRDNRDWNDFLALLNSLVLLVPTIYVTHVTVWKGDYSCVFRVLAVQLLRAFCGWYTYLPPDPTYLSSNYDFPDFVHCLIEGCPTTSSSAEAAAQQQESVIPFVSFFSGHVATMVVAGNHMWLSGYVNMAVLVHVLNVCQIVRLLATRGHYSIDMIIGWYVAVYVSNPAGRLGKYYSRGTTFQEMMPKTTSEAFERITGVQHARHEARMSAISHRPEIQKVLQDIYKEEKETSVRLEDVGGESDTTAKILQETASKMVCETQGYHLVEEQLKYLREQKDAIELQMGKLREQAYAVVDRGHNHIIQQPVPVVAATTKEKPKAQ